MPPKLVPQKHPHLGDVRSLHDKISRRTYSVPRIRSPSRLKEDIHHTNFKEMS